MRTWTIAVAVILFTGCKPTEDSFDEDFGDAYCDRQESCNPEQECEQDEPAEDDTGDSEPSEDYTFNRDLAADCIKGFKEAECTDIFGVTIVVPPEVCFDVYEEI